MKKIFLAIIVFLCFNVELFSNNMFLTYSNNGEIKIDYNFDFEATNLYVANISFYALMKTLDKDYIKVSGINEVLNYLKFFQPGFSINYRYKNDSFNDPNYFLWSNDSFIISFERVFFDYPVSYIVSNGMIGINLKNSSNNYFYWINMYDFSETSLGYYFGNKLKLGFFVDTLNKSDDYGVFIALSNVGILTLSKNKFFVEILNKKIYMYFDFKNEINLIRNEFFKREKSKFEFNIPIIRDDIYFVLNSNRVYGIKFNIEF
ncbi:hypothetical protein SAMN02745164_01293 [Marinitoga hydrogenitolerans DSM 16785]|uniref:Uncharacterized protein n=1 Tax=Marinitoga hydrogenitolerans (strain DSM 16785 / JCM 12826 / AT1271) TaxID=1122195 RepID=A0A1M4WYX4_MARH1|nr:hypothetical protein [Marinitoga hydrogenitolerans]SHE86414.1 hypothetical protein SAMN02745164_01293 [Marinitoga hydrogenitolerans DSM 16785]